MKARDVTAVSSPGKGDAFEPSGALDLPSGRLIFVRRRAPFDLACFAGVCLAGVCLAAAACTPLRPLDGAGIDAATRDATVIDAARDAPSSDTREDTPRDDARAPGSDGGPDAYRCRSRCEDATLVECISDTEQRTSCALGCVETPSPHCGELVPTNLPDESFEASTDVVLGPGEFGILSIDTTMCTGVPGLVRRTQDDDSPICVLEGRTVTVPMEAVVFLRGTAPFAIAASGEVSIAGLLYGAGFSGAPGPGGGAGGTDTIPAGGAQPGQRGTSVTSEDGGGGGGGGCGAGGSGGRGGTTFGGAGGMAVASTLEPLGGGSGGGAGGGVSGRFGVGGPAGGGIQITSLERITITGSVLVGGGAGQLSPEGSMGGGAQSGAGGGGGSGGNVLLEAPVVVVSPMTGRVLASGGGGAAGGGVGTETTATDGVLAEGPAAGGMASTSGGNGGASGGGATSDATAGSDAPTNGNGGGGGGGAGCILLRAGTITTTGAVLSPSGVGLTTSPLRLR